MDKGGGKVEGGDDGKGGRGQVEKGEEKADGDEPRMGDQSEFLEGR